MDAVRRGIVRSLEWLCGALDQIPFVWHDDDGWRLYRHGLLGCHPLGLANRAANLDERWGTDAWGPPPDTPSDR